MTFCRKYFSVLGNEANLRGKKEAWLILGVDDKKNIVGTSYRLGPSLQNLKKEIVDGTNNRLTFLEIYELFIEEKRIVVMQIPPASRGFQRCGEVLHMHEKMKAYVHSR